VRARILTLTKVPPPEETRLTRWSSYEMTRYLHRRAGISVSHNFVSTLWRACDRQPHRQGSFTVSHDPDFTTKVTDNNADVDGWLAKHPNVTFHFTPKGASWIN